MPLFNMVEMIELLSCALKDEIKTTLIVTLLEKVDEHHLLLKADLLNVFISKADIVKVHATLHDIVFLLESRVGAFGTEEQKKMITDWKDSLDCSDFRNDDAEDTGTGGAYSCMAGLHSKESGQDGGAGSSSSAMKKA